MFSPAHAGINGDFCCLHNSLFVPFSLNDHAREIVPLVQSFARSKEKLNFPYLLVRKDDQTMIGVPDGKEATTLRALGQKLGMDSNIPVIPANVALDVAGRSTSRLGLLFSGVYKIYSHLCTLSYAYYIKDESLVSDEFYDQLWRAFDYRYSQTPDALRNHPHFKLLKYADIEGGSFHRVPEWPVWVQNATQLYFNYTRGYCE